ncbi:MAG TPA: HAD-IA family hydrolase [Candidatus Binatia bacterium]|nr:HAD-IA family hydrolase [Candidatus Binatia bacterium]
MSGARFGVVLLDLDGTLLDTRADLVASTNHVRASFDLPPLEAREVERLVGHGARVLVERALGVERAEIHDEGVRRFLDHYERHCLDHTRPYPGMAELLDSLSAEGVRFAVLTNKPQRLSRKILGGLNLLDAFAVVVGGDTFPERKPHPRGVRHVLERCAAQARAALMVGDSAVDVETARAADIAMCGVSWGFDPESLRATGVELVAADAAELRRIIWRGAP